MTTISCIFNDVPILSFEFEIKTKISLVGSESPRNCITNVIFLKRLFIEKVYIVHHHMFSKWCIVLVSIADQ